MENYISCAVSKVLIFHLVKLNYKTLSICISETASFSDFSEIIWKKIFGHHKTI